jgi:hypothetical protein
VDSSATEGGEGARQKRAGTVEKFTSQNKPVVISNTILIDLKFPGLIKSA